MTRALASAVRRSRSTCSARCSAICWPIRQPWASQPAIKAAKKVTPYIHCLLMQHLPERLSIQRIPRLAVGLARSPCSDIQIPCSLGVTQRRQPVRVSPEQEPGQPCGQHIVMLDSVPHAAGVQRYAPDHTQACSQVTHSRVVVAQQATDHAAALLCLPERLCRPDRPRWTPHQLPAVLEPALLQTNGQQHYHCLGTGHLGGQQFERRGNCRGADFSEGHGFSPGVKKPPSGGQFETQDTAIVPGSWHSSLVIQSDDELYLLAGSSSAGALWPHHHPPRRAMQVQPVITQVDRYCRIEEVPASIKPPRQPVCLSGPRPRWRRADNVPVAIVWGNWRGVFAEAHYSDLQQCVNQVQRLVQPRRRVNGVFWHIRDLVVGGGHTMISAAGPGPVRLLSCCTRTVVFGDGSAVVKCMLVTSVVVDPTVTR